MSKPTKKWQFIAGATIHLTFIAVARWRGLAFDDRWPVVLLYLMAVAGAIYALAHVPRFHPKWLRISAIVLGCVWFCMFVVFVGLVLLVVGSRDPVQTLTFEGSVVTGYSGCGSFLVDPCIIVRQEWRIAPGVSLVRPLYRAWGDKFVLERIDGRSVRVIAPAWHAERDREAEVRVLTLADSPWTWQPEKSTVFGGE